MEKAKAKVKAKAKAKEREREMRSITMKRMITIISSNRISTRSNKIMTTIITLMSKIKKTKKENKIITEKITSRRMKMETTSTMGKVNINMAKKICKMKLNIDRMTISHNK